eukprot:CAMPEP_0184869260 /NCGR_PEP_ID=MMETSP0580-20130426/33483_1 /TAXON_ID=1118495 /ORGANISM="Dactyliosolen fragilissimus" /LENGTH=1159 /DNA_ID=CAMNT_0027370633 /DNA_START=32 /DNA_END=3511 /DNA_ORIENTATION=+
MSLDDDTLRSFVSSLTFENDFTSIVEISNDKERKHGEDSTRPMPQGLALRSSGISNSKMNEFIRFSEANSSAIFVAMPSLSITKLDSLRYDEIPMNFESLISQLRLSIKEPLVYSTDSSQKSLFTAPSDLNENLTHIVKKMFEIRVKELVSSQSRNNYQQSGDDSEKSKAMAQKSQQNSSNSAFKSYEQDPATEMTSQSQNSCSTTTSLNDEVVKDDDNNCTTISEGFEEENENGTASFQSVVQVIETGHNEFSKKGSISTCCNTPQNDALISEKSHHKSIVRKDTTSLKPKQIDDAEFCSLKTLDGIEGSSENDLGKEKGKANEQEKNKKRFFDNSTDKDQFVVELEKKATKIKKINGNIEKPSKSSSDLKFKKMRMSVLKCITSFDVPNDLKSQVLGQELVPTNKRYDTREEETSKFMHLNQVIMPLTFASIVEIMIEGEQSFQSYIELGSVGNVKARLFESNNNRPIATFEVCFETDSLLDSIDSQMAIVLKQAEKETVMPTNKYFQKSFANVSNQNEDKEHRRKDRELRRISTGSDAFTLTHSSIIPQSLQLNQVQETNVSEAIKPIRCHSLHKDTQLKMASDCDKKKAAKDKAAATLRKYQSYMCNDSSLIQYSSVRPDKRHWSSSSAYSSMSQTEKRRRVSLDNTQTANALFQRSREQNKSPDFIQGSTAIPTKLLALKSGMKRVSEPSNKKNSHLTQVSDSGSCTNDSQNRIISLDIHSEQRNAIYRQSKPNEPIPAETDPKNLDIPGETLNSLSESAAEIERKLAMDLLLAEKREDSNKRKRSDQPTSKDLMASSKDSSEKRSIEQNKSSNQTSKVEATGDVSVNNSDKMTLLEGFTRKRSIRHFRSDLNSMATAADIVKTDELEKNTSTKALTRRSSIGSNSSLNSMAAAAEIIRMAEFENMALATGLRRRGCIRSSSPPSSMAAAAEIVRMTELDYAASAGSSMKRRSSSAQSSLAAAADIVRMTELDSISSPIDLARRRSGSAQSSMAAAAEIVRMTELDNMLPIGSALRRRSSGSRCSLAATIEATRLADSENMLINPITRRRHRTENVISARDSNRTKEFEEMASQIKNRNHTVETGTTLTIKDHTNSSIAEKSVGYSENKIHAETSNLAMMARVEELMNKKAEIERILAIDNFVSNMDITRRRSG